MIKQNASLNLKKTFASLAAVVSVCLGLLGVFSDDPAGANVAFAMQRREPVINWLTANPATGSSPGEPVTLRWSVSRATSLQIDNGVGDVTGSNSITVNPSVSTTYRLTATNSSGWTFATTDVLRTGGGTTQDTTPPSVPFNVYAVAISSSRLDVHWNISTDDVGVAGYGIYRDGSLIATTSATSYSDNGLPPNTTFSYRVTAYDAAGNTSAQSPAITGTTSGGGGGGDVNPPTVAISSPANGQNLTGTAAITASASDNTGVVGVQFYVDGSPLGSEDTSAPYSINWNTGQTASGSHTLVAVAHDAAGNYATSAGVTVTVGNSSLRPYSTSFPSTENPISENGNWINGKATGLDWTDIRTVPGLAFGTQSGNFETYNDSVAILSGNWLPDQTAQATVYTVNQSLNYFQEVELWLRARISPHSISGYEINFRCTGNLGDGYMQIVRWNGPLNSFTYVDFSGPGIRGVRNGDVVKASIAGNTITVWVNGVQVAQGSDNTFTSGSPGMGFYLQNKTGVNGDFGFTNYYATDGSTASPPSSDTTAPTLPGWITASAASSSQVHVSWDAATDNVGVSGYRIYRNNVQIATTNYTSFSDSGLSANTAYSYYVTAFDAAGNVSTASRTASVQTLGGSGQAAGSGQTPESDSTPPSVPSQLQLSNVTSGSVTLSWTAATDNVGVAGYKIFRNGGQVGTTTSTSYVDTGLAATTTYAYTVAAFDSAGNSSSQSQQMATTTSAAAQNPPSFVQSNATQISNGAGVSIPFANATTAGNAIVAYVIWSNNGPVAVTDSRGNAFTAVSNPVIWGNGYSAQVFYSTGIAGGSDTVTAAFRDAVGPFGVIYVHEYSGIDAANPVDATTAAVGASTTLNSGNISTTSANDLIFGAGVSDNTVTNAGNGFIARSFAFGNITEDRIASSPGSYSATATHQGNIWAMQVVAFRPSN